MRTGDFCVRQGKLAMCLPKFLHQSTSYGPWDRRRFLMAGVVVSAVVILFIVVIALVAAKNSDECMGELECLPISKCEGHINPDFIYGCGNHDTPKICCVAKKNTTELNENDEYLQTASRIEKEEKLLPKNCGVGQLGDKIAHGTNASLAQFPWMVILNYQVPGLRGRTTPLCGATLINERYLLTAAHCVVNQKLQLSSGTLGDLNLATEKDCVYYEGDDPDCSDPPVTIDIEKIIPHEKYNTVNHKNDIALLRLVRSANISGDFIKPICLPFGLTINEEYFLSKNFTIVGWGYTGPSSNAVNNILQYTYVTPWKANRCNDALKDPYKPIENRQVCANGPGLQEACVGDSGGPMSYEHLHEDKKLKTTQLGIVSFKPMNTCGSVDIPAVYTRVDKYLNWILDNIEP